jgi:hypothetical protein
MSNKTGNAEPAAKTTAKIMPCNCLNDFQDRTYGKRMRVHTFHTKTAKDVNPSYSCTVCGTTRSR